MRRIRAGAVAVSSDRPVTIGAATVLALLLLVLGVRALRSHWTPVLDLAVVEFRTRQVGTTHTPLLGPYSRYTWHHPGPLMFYVFALPYRVLGAQPRGLLLGALTTNISALVAIAAVCRRRGRSASLLGGALVLLLLRGLGPDFLLNPWNPFVIVVPMLAVVLLCWAAMDGSARWALPTAVGIGSFAAQSHVGAAIGVAVPIAIAAVFLVKDHQRLADARLRRTGRHVMAVGLVCWAPPIIEQLGSSPGNLTKLVVFFTTGHRKAVGLPNALRLVFAQLAIPAPWFTGHEAPNAFTAEVEIGWRVPIALASLVAALVIARRRRDTRSVRLCVLALGVVGAGVVATARIFDTPFFYLVRWLWVIGPVVWFAIFFTIAAALPRERAHVLISGIGGATAIVLSVVVIAGAARASAPEQRNDGRSLAAFAECAVTALRAAPAPVLVDGASIDLRSAGIADGIFMLGVKAGIDVRRPSTRAHMVGEASTIEAAHAGSAFVVATDEAAASYHDHPGYRLVGLYDPLTPSERAERRTLQAELDGSSAGSLAGALGWVALHPDRWKRLQELGKRGPRIELFRRASPSWRGSQAGEVRQLGAVARATPRCARERRAVPGL